LKIELQSVASAPPIRSELFSAERLEEHARSLARAQRVGSVAVRTVSLSRKLKHNADLLVRDYRALAKTAKAAKPITSAGEWFLDNFYVVEEQTREIVKDLPPSYYRELPKLLDGPLAGYPRVHGIAWAVIAHSDSALDPHRLKSFIDAYQSVTPLTIGELWAIAITLRLALVENLSRLIRNVVARAAASERAEAAANEMTLALLREEPESGIFASIEDETITPAFLARLEQRLRDQGAPVDSVLRELEHRLENHGATLSAVIQGEYQARSADDISVRNIITSMRLISNIDWAEFFESVSLVDRALRAVPTYERMDFATRDRYRRTVEHLARGTHIGEIEIARRAVRDARAAEQMKKPPREADAGHYLIGHGQRAFERRIGFSPGYRQRILRTLASTGLTGYLLAIALVCALILATAMAMEANGGVPLGALLGLIVLGLIPASDLALALVNRFATRRKGPEPLPSLSLKDGPPDGVRGVLVVPVLLTRVEDIEEQMERLEVHYLSNADAQLRFILLSDWTDSDTETTPGDDALLAAARAGIDALNKRHAAGSRPLFLLLHRKRQWNAVDGKWMGWERKRGKLHELNRLLRGKHDTSFLDADAAIAALPPDIRYVITLDADTRLPRGAALRMIGKMAHPLNAPEVDPKTGCVTAGHGVLQPRVTPSLPIGSESSLFQWAFSGPTGLDPYAFAVSDVYQDLFDEGSYVGKGIYDIDAFEAALDRRIPENAVLSHDLLEGIFARAALASDIEVVEEFPSRYDVELSRQHRWLRGDWQLLPWILGFGSARKTTKTPHLPALGRWKMIDNLRRSLSAPALLLSLLCGWLLPAAGAMRWSLFMLAVVAVPPFLPITTGLWPGRRGFSLRAHLRNVARDIVLASTQVMFTVSFLARVAYLSLDAIARTLFRVFFSRRRLLEWMTFAQSAYTKRGGNHGVLAFQLLGSFAFAGITASAIVLRAPENEPFAVPFLVLWALSPIVARWASQTPEAEPQLEVSPADAAALRLAARRTWLFFERFVTVEDNWLPPDNYQETPKPLVAHRTSPTNIGLYLCTILAARDFGWIGTAECVERLDATLATLQKMSRYRGHFLNWYSTADLSALYPRYVSTVDSGNLAGNLIVVRNACEEMRHATLPTARLAGLTDTIDLLRSTIDGALRLDEPLLQEMRDLLDRLGVASAMNPEDPGVWVHLDDIEARADALAAEIPQETAYQRALQDAARAIAAWVKSHRADRDIAERTDGAAETLSERLARIEEICRLFVAEMDFAFLYDGGRQLLSIGYRVDDQHLDGNVYDLLASEARLASFVAIAKGDVPTRHWFHLGRTLTPLGRSSALQSWSGSMFEYLMPTLIMREPRGSLLAQSNRAAVRRQIDYATHLGLPWGISESQYNARDRDQNYQYSGFGVPDLGIKRGLSENIVIAPYASGLAAMVAPPAARRNLDRLARLGALGTFGWYEAIDYTRARLPEGRTDVVIQAYMSHHQGMMILGIADVLCGAAMRERFHAEPMVKATELLLQERMPRDVAMARLPPEMSTGATTLYDSAPRAPRRFTSPHTATPRTHLLSNDEYSVMVTAAGSGYSRWRDMAVTRWQEDGTRDHWGSFIYLRDLRSGKIWSAGHQPVGAEADAYEALFSEDRANIARTDGALTTSLEILVSPEDNAEVRRLSITNRGTRLREIEITSYMELALARPADDDAHPAFSKLFVETEYLNESGALLATRRPRSPDDPTICAAHLSIVDGESVGDVQYETDRAKFLSRNRTARAPGAIFSGWPLSNSAGPVLDPVFALRRRIQVPRGRTVTIAFWTMAAETRDEMEKMIGRHQETTAFERAATLAATHAQSQLQYLGLVGDEAHLFQLLANHVIYADAALRAPREILKAAAPPATALWPLGISGDMPIVVVRIGEEEHLDFVRQMIRAHDYWRIRRLAVDLVILNERASSYAQDLQKALDKIVHTFDRGQNERQGMGRIHLVQSGLLGSGTVAALRAIARIDLSARRGNLAEQLAAVIAADDEVKKPAMVQTASRAPEPPPAVAMPRLERYNGYGGFTSSAREYAVIVRPGQPTPAPWINVIANAKFGFQVSAEGAGYAWAQNSQQNKITPWSNDPVSNESGSAIYIRDLVSGALWSATASPIADPSLAYVAYHGQGYSRFQTEGRGISIELLEFVPLEDTIKISRLRVANVGAQPRRLSLTHFADWALGQSRDAAAPCLITEVDPETRAFHVSNPCNGDAPGQVAFLDMNGLQQSWTGDRREFLGRNGSRQAPAALLRDEPLSGRLGVGFDPCGAQQAEIVLAPGEERDIFLFLGWGANATEARALLSRYREADIDAAFAEVGKFWNETLETLQVETPDPEMDILVNRWLLYQTLSCRMWGRAGFYQASGAYGFRDQLQDGMALTHARPTLVREHLLRAAGRQFAEGDVQHWWLPESGKGIRSRISDDRAWLAYVAAHYVEATGDTAALDAELPFLSGPPLREGEHDAFYRPEVSTERASLYEHCARALDASLGVGAHGLPLMGTGDWNDGMNRVGENGKGESVWLGWFLHETLSRFFPYAEARKDGKRAASWLVHMSALRQALDDSGWDGAWYRRAFFDDGFALGSSANRECRIDSIAQSWAVISGIAPPERARQAMEAVDKYLVRREDRLLTLFAPPFVASAHDPGYIKGYPAGIRENGGQYTHGVLWSIIAFAKLGNGDRAAELFAMLNPINHARSASEVERYRVEPYVACADVYSMPPNAGRGGWTWYTGAAAWMYRTAVEYILGLRFRGDRLFVEPVIPRNWPGFEATIKQGRATYRLHVDNAAGAGRGVKSATLDGTAVGTEAGFALIDDGATHRIEVVLGEQPVRVAEPAAR
jgi:cyclic beta-1,2-glucan glucanotransferase